MSANNDTNLRRLVNSNFNRPKTTYTDTLQNKAAMQEKLKNYKRVDDIDDVPINTHVRYVTLDKEQKQVFRLGGLLKKIHSKYVQLSNGTYTWSVQRYHYKNDTDEEPIFETVFFRVIPTEERYVDIIKQQEQKIKLLEAKIKQSGGKV
jgi:non-ribosomal peptide synthetase component E (peptide arylation enzyme)